MQHNNVIHNGDNGHGNEIVPVDLEDINDDNPEEVLHEEEDVLEEFEEEEDNVNVIIGNNAGVRHPDVLELDNGFDRNNVVHHDNDDDEAGHDPGDIDVHNVIVNGMADEAHHNLRHNDLNNVAENVVVDDAGHDPGDIDVGNIIVNGMEDEVLINLIHNDVNNVAENVVVDDAGHNPGDIDVHNVIVIEIQQNVGHNDANNVAEDVVVDEADHNDGNNFPENGVVVEAEHNLRPNIVQNPNPVLNGFLPEEEDTMAKRIEGLLAHEPANTMLTLNVNHSNSLHIEGLTNAFVNLRHLSMSHVGLISLANFPELPRLIKLDVSHNAIINELEVLRNAPLLRYLDLSYNPIREFETLLPLRHFNNLWYLQLNEVQIPNILERRLDVFHALPILVALNKFDANLREISDLQIQRDCSPRIEPA